MAHSPFREFGRVVHTVYLLRWIAMDSRRGDATGDTNEVENFHAFSGHPGFGSERVLRTNNAVEQEKATVYCPLIANAVMLQTLADQARILLTRYAEGCTVLPDDLAFLGPCVTGNFKCFGDYRIRC